MSACRLMLDAIQNQEDLGFFCRRYRLFLSPDMLMSFVHLELTAAAKVNVMYSERQRCCRTVDVDLCSGVGSS